MAKIIYELKRWHHKRCYRKGDLESQDVQDYSDTFATRKAANEYLSKRAAAARRNGWKTNIKLVKRGNEDSELFIYTNDTWIHENTGANEQETYWYDVKKKTL